ncbi:hypothetical protein [Streptomyces sp. NPDC086777]|uniref:hypothetical protein n=1 Tax=Streptomyces sp. NPDC086777 TaxID=3154866 RepID=UPI00344F4BC0
MGPGVRDGREVTGGGLGRVAVRDGEGGGALGSAVMADGGGGGALGRAVVGGTEGRLGGAVVGGTEGGLGGVVVGGAEGGGALGPCGVTDGVGVGVWGRAGFVVGVCTGGGRTGAVGWAADRVPAGTGGTAGGSTGGTVRVGLGAGVRVGFRVVGAGELGADDRGGRDGDGLGADGVTTGGGVGWEALPPWSDDSSAQAARPPPRAITAAPPAIHGARRDGCRCRFMILTVHPIADGLKPEPGRRTLPAAVRRCPTPGLARHASGRTGLVRRPVVVDTPRGRPARLRPRLHGPSGAAPGGVAHPCGTVCPPASLR